MMSEPQFSPGVKAALDFYTVPPLPGGFADRLMTRIASGDTASQSGAADSPRLRRRNAGPWRRTGRIFGSVALFSFVAAAAAAAGIFGKPIYLPGLSEALVKAKIVAAPKETEPKRRQLAKGQTVPQSGTTSSAQAATGSAAIVRRVGELRSDPDYAQLPRRQRMVIVGKEVRQMVRSGEASRQDVRAAVRTLAQDADPAVKQAWRKAAVQRRERRRDNIVAARNEAEVAPIVTTDPAGATSEPTTAKDVDSSPTSAANPPPDTPAQLRERYRAATSEQRAAMRAALRERRQSQLRRRAQ